MGIAAYIPDLMDRSKVAAAAQSLGVDVSFARTPGDLDLSAALILVDLGRPGVIEALAGYRARSSGGGAAGDSVGPGGGAAGHSVGFASHVDRELLARGREAGCDQVLARSAFFSRLPSILSGASDGPGEAAHQDL